MKKTKTVRGFDIVRFADFYGASCSLQESSLAEEEAIWLGVDNADPKILASKIIEGGTGWAKYPIPEDVLLTTRMHLTRKQVKELLPHLQKFVESGEI